MSHVLRTTRTNLGKTDLSVPRLGLGGAPLGNLRDALPNNQVYELIRFAYDSGTTLFDTAPLYGAGVGERRFGQALQGIPRDSYVLSSKVGRIVETDGEVSYDYSREGVLRSIEASLERLGIGRIDILHIHDADDHYQQALDEAFPTLAELRSQGVIRAIGAGMNQWQMEWEFAKNADFDCFLLAGRYTLLEQTSLDFLNYCHEKGIGIFLGGVYNSGILARGANPTSTYNYKPAPPEIIERVQRLEGVAQRHNVSMRAAALQFAIAHPAVTALVVGAESKDEFAQTMAEWDASIPGDFWSDLREQGLIEPGAPLPET